MVYLNQKFLNLEIDTDIGKYCLCARFCKKSNIFLVVGKILDKRVGYSATKNSIAFYFFTTIFCLTLVPELFYYYHYYNYFALVIVSVITGKCNIEEHKKFERKLIVSGKITLF